MNLSEQWLQRTEKILNVMKENQENADKDRLESINSILYSLTALGRSIKGWQRWASNLTFMTRFNADELHQMEVGLINVVRDFIEFDMDTTKQHLDKIPKTRFRVKRRQSQADTSGLFA
jgi:hypothetical protein